MSEQKSIRVYIITADPHAAEGDWLEAHGFQIQGVETDGLKAADTILRLRPDAVLCDTYVNNMDALGIVEKVRARGYTGIFFCLSQVSNEPLCATLMRAGADYFFVRPFTMSYLSERLTSYHKQRASAAVTVRLPVQITDEFELESYISEMMRQIGVPAHIRGYNYIRKAIMMALENKELLNAITKELYPGVARSYGTTPSRVERAIRHAIEVAWTRGDIEALNAMFGYTVKTSKGKPTNGEFISMLTDRLRMNLKIN